MYQGDFDTHFVVYVGQYRFQNHDFPLSWCNGESKGLFPTKYGKKWKISITNACSSWGFFARKLSPWYICFDLMWTGSSSNIQIYIKKRRNAKKESLNASLHCPFPFQIPNQHWQFWNGEGIRPCFEDEAPYFKWFSIVQKLSKWFIMLQNSWYEE